MKDDLTQKINRELEIVQNKMRETIREEEERGANIQHLEEQTGRLEERTHVFEQNAERTEWKTWFRAVKWYFAAAFIVVTVLVFMFFR